MSEIRMKGNTMDFTTWLLLIVLGVVSAGVAYTKHNLWLGVFAIAIFVTTMIIPDKEEEEETNEEDD